MATMNDDELYLIARRVLLDALDALGEHRDAIVLVGAQAVYLRVGDADLALAPYTTDADLVIDPHRLAEIPPLEQVLLGAGGACCAGGADVPPRPGACGGRSRYAEGAGTNGLATTKGRASARRAAAGVDAGRWGLAPGVAMATCAGSCSSTPSSWSPGKSLRSSLSSV